MAPRSQQWTQQSRKRSHLGSAFPLFPLCGDAGNELHRHMRLVLQHVGPPDTPAGVCRHLVGWLKVEYSTLRTQARDDRQVFGVSRRHLLVEGCGQESEIVSTWISRCLICFRMWLRSTVAMGHRSKTQGSMHTAHSARIRVGLVRFPALFFRRLLCHSRTTTEGRGSSAMAELARNKDNAIDASTH